MKKKEDIFFSIVIPVHNRAHTLDRCIQSIQAQSYKNFELILVDDHSSDNSVMVIKDYCKNDSRIILVEQAVNKHGAQAARNTGIFASKYDWIMFNDSDDTWEINKIERQLELIKANNYDENLIMYSDCNTININTNIKQYWNLPHVPKIDSYKFLLKQPAPIFISLTCSKALLKKINFLDENVPAYQEWDTSIRLSKFGYVEHQKEALVNYYIGADDAISKSPERDFIGKCYILNKFKSEIIANYSSTEFRYLLNKNFNEEYIMSDSPVVREYLANSFLMNLNVYKRYLFKEKVWVFIKKVLYKIQEYICRGKNRFN